MSSISSRLISLMFRNGMMMLFRLYISRLWCSSVLVLSVWYFMFLSVSGIRKMMISVLKIIVERIVFCGVVRCIMLSVLSVG